MRRAQRIALAVLALDELVVGLWNQFFPQSFYANFPTVDLTPPFSEHYARDFGGATLGIAAVLLVALIRPDPWLVLVAGLAYSLFGVPHFVFHLEHLEHATTVQAILLTAGNGVVALLGVFVTASAVVRISRDRAALRHPAVG